MITLAQKMVLAAVVAKSWKQQRLIGHIHIAKTGGTTLNGLMANQYHGVCGHKGYSFDFYQANQRSRNHPGEIKDSIGKVFPGYDRTRVPWKIMLERGFETCLWISLESAMTVWHHFDTWHMPLELHLPCRDPIDHFMSQVNFRGIKLDCTAFKPQHADKYLVGMNRFQSAHIPANATVRCIHFRKQFSDYAARVNLPPKSVFRPLRELKTNRPRIKPNECIWKNESLKVALAAHLIANYDYYNFCNACTDWVV